MSPASTGDSFCIARVAHDVCAGAISFCNLSQGGKIKSAQAVSPVRPHDPSVIGVDLIARDY